MSQTFRGIIGQNVLKLDLIRVQGFNKHRDLFLIGLSKLKIAQIQDVRPLPLNGCRKPAKRRL